MGIMPWTVASLEAEASRNLGAARRYWANTAPQPFEHVESRESNDELARRMHLPGSLLNPKPKG